MEPRKIEDCIPVLYNIIFAADSDVCEEESKKKNSLTEQSMSILYNAVRKNHIRICMKFEIWRTN